MSFIIYFAASSIYSAIEGAKTFKRTNSLKEGGIAAAESAKNRFVECRSNIQTQNFKEKILNLRVFHDLSTHSFP